MKKNNRGEIVALALLVYGIVGLVFYAGSKEGIVKDDTYERTVRFERKSIDKKIQEWNKILGTDYQDQSKK